eukprot:CAMPEP_0181229658 /NCGR_PEP_ID=MMETSP1096-20121128/34022_1 /TAXON_ID=156174 ORGANISM="Chrysochromulina ericina, Strain CCMP281" /NCGR_SAMPLE_ID=MMETSP1096 /ASSEMBLY_ACC=CAM_ASM_000453 /LENGTH=31 /DNA_ID= /DNA_START= /DNA_END= /DNA_ORIENTATION=
MPCAIMYAVDHVRLLMTLTFNSAPKVPCGRV